jgi:AraC-like DNA-binding protein
MKNESNDQIINTKRGYLQKDFELFHLKDVKEMQFESHYHDFNKIVIFISGDVTYLIEGKSYKLRPWDMLLINSRQMHKAAVGSGEPYERIIIWVNPEFLDKHNYSGCDLLTCFELCLNRNYNLIRLDPELLRDARRTLSQLEDACKSESFGSHILKNSLFMQLIVYINRFFLGAVEKIRTDDYEYNDSIGSVLKYINDDLGEDLSIDRLASIFYLSKYHLMHQFRKQTGYTIHNYILQKRLMLALSLFQKSRSFNDISMKCGFSDYSTFMRAFKKMFGLTPRDYCKSDTFIQKK